MPIVLHQTPRWKQMGCQKWPGYCKKGKSGPVILSPYHGHLCTPGQAAQEHGHHAQSSLRSDTGALMQFTVHWYSVHYQRYCLTVKVTVIQWR